MKLHNTTKYAIRILSYIAKHDANRLHSAKELSNELKIPYKFLTKIMTDLVKTEFIISIKGRDGGYKLAKTVSNIKIMDILDKFNDQSNYNECILGIGLCDVNNRCVLHDKWIKPKELIHKMLKETTLENLKRENFKL